jgi:hypothetical protein
MPLAREKEKIAAHAYLLAKSINYAGLQYHHFMVRLARPILSLSLNRVHMSPRFFATTIPDFQVMVIGNIRRCATY